MQLKPHFDFASVYSDHAPYVRRLLVRNGVRAADLDDVMQEVFVAVHRQLPSFEGRSRIETWLHAVTWRVAANYHRGRGRRELERAQADETADGPTSSSPDKSVRARLGQMSAEHRDVLTMHDLAGFSISELAAMSGKARATIRERLNRGRTALGRRMWNALTGSDEEWLDRLAPRLAARLAQPERPVVEHVVCEQTAISTLDDIVIVLFRGPASSGTLEALIEVMFCALDQHPDGIRHMCIIEPTSTPPSQEVRQLVSWAAGKMGARVRAASWAVEDQKMMSLVAPIMNACIFIGGVQVNARFFDAVRPASDWLAQYGALEARKIADHVEVMRQRLGDQGAPG